MKIKLLLYILLCAAATPILATAKTIDFKESVHLALTRNPIIAENKARMSYDRNLCMG